MPRSPEPLGVSTRIAADARAMAEEAAEVLVAEIEAALAARGSAAVILAGGTTPREAYGLLAEAITARRIPVARLSWSFGDERWVPADQPQSNEAMARAALLDRIGAPPGTIRSWQAGTGDPVECARRYAGLVEASQGPQRNEPPDVLLLGLGADGHTASLFPGSIVRLPDGRAVPVGPDLPSVAAAVEPAGDRGWRLTLCPGYLRASRCAVFLVAGAEKAPALRRVREGDPALPGSWIRARRTIFIATRDAAGPDPEDLGRSFRHA
jgi:6-phosphogluconolactonase